jgi:hypothetical protein
MRKQLFYLVCAFALFYMNDADASKRTLTEDDNDRKSSVRCTPSNDQQPVILNTFSGLPHELHVIIAENLGPLSYSRFLQTSKSLSSVKSSNNLSPNKVPIPFGNTNALLEEINRKLNNKMNPMNDIDYFVEFGNRLRFSFNSIFGATVKWKDLLEKLKVQRDEIKIRWGEYRNSSAYKTVEALQPLYTKLAPKKSNKEGLAEFLKDTSERHEAFAKIRPLLLLGIVTEQLYHNYRKDVQQNPDADQSFRNVLIQHHRIYDTYTRSTKEQRWVHRYGLHYFNYNLFLRWALWRVMAYHDAICFDLHQKEHVEDFQVILLGHASKMQHLLEHIPAFKFPIQHTVIRNMDKETNSYLSTLLGLLKPEDFGEGETQGSESLTQVRFNHKVHNAHHQAFFEFSLTDIKNGIKGNDIAAKQELAKCLIRGAENAQDDRRKALYYRQAGSAKLEESELTYDCTAKATVLNEAAQYLATAAELHPDCFFQAAFYERARQAAEEEASVWGSKTAADRAKQADAWKRAVDYGAANLTDLQKAALFGKAGDAKYQQGLFWQSALSYEKAAEVESNIETKASYYLTAGQVRNAHGDCQTDYQLKAESYAKSALNFENGAKLTLDPVRKYNYYEEAGREKKKEADLWSAQTDLAKKIDAHAETARLHAEAAKYADNASKRINSYTNAHMAKWNEWELLTDPNKKVEAAAQANFYLQKISR